MTFSIRRDEKNNGNRKEGRNMANSNTRKIHFKIRNEKEKQRMQKPEQNLNRVKI
jgi:hypothetical protein